MIKNFLWVLLCANLLSACFSGNGDHEAVTSNRTIDSTNTLAHSLIRTDRDSSISLLRKSLSQSRALNYRKGESRSLSVIGITHSLQGNYDSAIYYHRASLDIRLQTPNPVDEAKSYSNIGEVYQDIGDYPKGIQFADSAIDIYRANDSIQYLSGIFGNMAICYIQSGQVDSAGKYFKSSLTWALIKSSQPRVLLSAYKNYGLFSRANIGKDTGLYYTRKALKIALDSQLHGELPGLYFGIGQLLAEDNKSAAISLYDSALVMANALQLPVLKEKILNWKLGLVQEDPWPVQKQVYDSLLLSVEQHYDGQRLKDFAEFEVKYGLAEKEAQNEILRATSELKTRRQRLLILLLFASIVVATFIGRTLLLTRKVAARDKELAEERIDNIVHRQEVQRIDDVIAAEESERKRIATELHDRLGSLLGALKLNYGALEDQHLSVLETSPEPHKAVKKLLHESITEVRKISHTMATGVVAQFGLIEAIRTLKTTIESSGKMAIELHENGLDDALSSHEEITLFRVIQEIIGNTLKHANAKSIEINLTRTDSQLIVVVDDDGTGFDTEKKSAGIGLQNIQNRIDSIGAQVWIDSHEKSGTSYTIELNLSHDRD